MHGLGEARREHKLSGGVMIVGFYRIWRILVGNKSVLFWVPVVAACVALGMTYVLPEQYESTVLVLVRPFEVIKFNPGASNKKEILDFPVSQAAPIDAPSKTYMEVIKSPAVAVKIVDALQLHIEKPRKYDSFFESLRDDVKIWVRDAIQTVRHYARYGRVIHASPFDRAVEDVEANLVVSTRKNTYAFDITYRSSHPEVAAAVANMAAEIFLEHSSEAYRRESARARGFIELQLEESRKALEQARAEILEYKNSGNTFELIAEYNEILKSVTDLENTLAKIEGKLAGLRRTFRSGNPNVVALEAEREELKEQVAILREQLATYPEKETRLNALTLTEWLAEESYKFFLLHYKEASVRASATITEIRIVSRARPALYPVKPVKYVYVGLSFGMAMVVAIGWALFFEYLEPRVRTIRDLDEEFDVPVLGAIPTLRRSGLTIRT